MVLRVGRGPSRAPRPPFSGRAGRRWSRWSGQERPESAPAVARPINRREWDVASVGEQVERSWSDDVEVRRRRCPRTPSPGAGTPTHSPSSRRMSMSAAPTPRRRSTASRRRSANERAAAGEAPTRRIDRARCRVPHVHPRRRVNLGVIAASTGSANRALRPTPCRGSCLPVSHRHEVTSRRCRCPTPMVRPGYPMGVGTFGPGPRFTGGTTIEPWKRTGGHCNAHQNIRCT